MTETASDSGVACVDPVPGRYQIYLCGQREVVEVSDQLRDQWPSQRVERMASFLSGDVRFPIPVSELISWGCVFHVL